MLIALSLSLGAEAASPKRVLVLHSFGRDVAPWNTSASAFRTELARRSPVPISFFEASLDLGRTVNKNEGLAFLEYLKARFGDAPPDVVVTIGAPAARFYLEHRSELFPETPLVVGALDTRFVRTMSLSTRDSVVAIRIELPRLVDNVLQLLPDTQTVAVVVGASDFERVWLEEFKREYSQYAGRINFVWLAGLSLAQMQERVANLPPHSAMLYAVLIVDAAGVPHERLDALSRLHSKANAPIFGLYENELGEGVVGGPYFSQRRHGDRMATAALRALGLPAPDQSQFDVSGFERAVYDARELQRWNIDPYRLPAEAEVRFKVRSVWEEHRGAIVATAVLLLLQAALIAGLLVQRGRRRRAEREAQLLGGRILTAQEDERRRLAREMHDDVTQRLAALAIDAARMQDDAGGSKAGNALETLRERLVGLSEDVHALSYRLHPSVIEDLGLVAALRVECSRVAQQEPVHVDFEHHDIPKKVPASAAICLFRIAQEALRNVARHANARNVAVSLQGKAGGIALVVRDDGKGFTESGIGGKASLGLVSMRERVRLAGGKVDIVGRLNEGTSVVAWVPLGEAA
ncbi:MAG: sensor histidine kinase [Burkholderiales bacterium]